MRTQGNHKEKTFRRWLSLGIVLVVILAVLVAVGGNAGTVPEEILPEAGEVQAPVVSTTEAEEPASTSPVFEGDPNNRAYPYNMMSADWGGEIYEQGFTYFEIPEEYKRSGGMFPEVAQVYLWSISRNAGVDYYTVLALIERESGYKYDSTGDNGNSKGLMQIYEKWHLDRMEEYGATDLYNPYDNMRVGVDFLAEIQGNYLESGGEACVLMAYNMGATTAKKWWDKGVYSTDYTRGILQRAQEIKQDLQDQ